MVECARMWMMVVGLVWVVARTEGAVASQHVRAERRGRACAHGMACDVDVDVDDGRWGEFDEDGDDDDGAWEGGDGRVARYGGRRVAVRWSRPQGNHEGKPQGNLGPEDDEISMKSNATNFSLTSTNSTSLTTKTNSTTNSESLDSPSPTGSIPAGSLAAQARAQLIAGGFAALRRDVVAAAVPGSLSSSSSSSSSLGDGPLGDCVFPAAAWECPAGFFCLSPTDAASIADGAAPDAACAPGFICPPAAYNPVYCCPGHYCPTPATIRVCPPGFFCPVGSTTPVACSPLASCPAGSRAPLRYGVVVVFAAVFLLIYAFFAIRALVIRHRNLKFMLYLQIRSKAVQERIDAARVAAVGPDTAAVADDTTAAPSSPHASRLISHASSSSSGLSLATITSTTRLQPSASSETLSQSPHAYLLEKPMDVWNDDEWIQWEDNWRASGTLPIHSPYIDAKNTADTNIAINLFAPPPGSPHENRITFDIHYTNLGLTLPNGLQIMHRVSGVLRAGRTCAVMGPSGAGKSTFFSLLMGKAKRTTGTIHINGIAEELSKYKKLIGFVPQEDVMLRELTVRDVLMHSALMRLPASWPYSRKKAIVLDVIKFLGLENVMGSPIGNEEERGISGGQRKRVNVGIELVAAPSLLLLDEPTSGLDSVTAYELTSLLQSIARAQLLNIAAIVHSPSAAAFALFDDLLLLGRGGQIIYSGPRDRATDYFHKLGFVAPPFENPAEFYMDIAQCHATSTMMSGYVPEDLFDCWQHFMCGRDPLTSVRAGTMHSRLVGPRDGKNARWGGGSPAARRRDRDSVRLRASIPGVAPILSRSAVRRNLDSELPVHANASEPPSGHAVYAAHTLHRSVSAVRMTAEDTMGVAKRYISDVGEEVTMTLRRITKEDAVRKTPSGIVIFWLCFYRACMQMYRSPQTLIFEQLLHVCMGLFISIAAQSSDYLGVFPSKLCALAPPVLSQSAGCAFAIDQLRTGGMFVCLGALFAGITSGINTFGHEITVFWRDTASGMPALPYFFAKWISDLPRIALGSVMFSVALSFSLPFRASPERLYIVVLALYFASYAMGYFLATLLERKTVPFAATGFVLMWSMVFGGVIIDLPVVDQNPVLRYVSWVWRLSAPRWAIEAWYIVESQARPWAELHNQDLLNGYLRENYIPAIVSVFLIGCMWALLALVALKLRHRSKQK